MAADDELITKLDYLFKLFVDLPKKIPEGGLYYSKKTFAVEQFNYTHSDGTDIGALHHRLEIVFGPLTLPEPFTFRERGEGLQSLVTVLREALACKSGDKDVVRRWTDKLVDSAVATYNRMEVERYMSGFDAESALADNALTWWKKNERDLPILARMARDYLAIPASSVSVERLFSAAGGLTTRERSSLSAKTIRECMCTKLWLRQGLMKFLK